MSQQSEIRDRGRSTPPGPDGELRAAAGPVEIRLLGPFEPVRGGRPADVNGAKRRGLLAVLALVRGRAVTVDELIGALWGDQLPAAPRNAVQHHITRIRAALGQDSIVASADGYALEATVDAVIFEDLLGQTRVALREGHVRDAADAAGRALALWRGTALQGLRNSEWLAGEARRLDALRVDALEESFEAALAAGERGEIVPAVQAALDEDPFRERLWGQLMLALYRAGRQADALDAFQQARTILAEELRLEPGPDLRRLQEAILANDPTLAPVGAAPAEQRLVTLRGPPRAARGRPDGAPRQGLVPRTSLVRRLSEANGVVVVCAPAGSGKTVLLRSWVHAARLHDRVAWVSVERDERDEQRFWLSLVDALAAVVGAVQRVAAAPSFRADALVERLVRDLERAEQDALLVIDDLHELESPEALACLGRLLDRLPPSICVVLATRQDPPLGLHRLRLAGELTEIRGEDLRFSLQEAAALLEAAEVSVSERSVALLCERTEGWAAGLRLAAISLAHHPDPERFVREFSGSERTVAGYLLTEVLERQPPEARELLLRTSILERVNGPLADHLTSCEGSERILQALEDANAFVTSIDAGRTWFRYHHLFADLLRLELRRLAPAAIGPLHRAAAQWHEREGDVVEAIRHAQAARDRPLATRLLSENYLDLTLDGRVGAVHELLAGFAPDAPTADGELALVRATVRLLEGAFDESAAYVDLADRLGDTVPAERAARFEVESAMLRLVVARWRGDSGAVMTAMRSLEAVRAQPTGDLAVSDGVRAVALLNLGVAELWSARTDDARRHLEEALAVARRGGRPWLEISPLGHLGIAGPWTGLSLSAGLERGEEAEKIAEGHGWAEDPVIVTALAAGALALLWLGRLDDAERRLERAERTLQPGGEPGTELVVHYARALERTVQGRFEDALAELRAAERMQGLLTDRHALGVSVRALSLRSLARNGQPAAARDGLAAVKPEDRDGAEMRMAEAVIHVSEDNPQEAVDVLAPVLAGAAPAIHPRPAAVEAQVLDAVARELIGDEAAAEASLERALELAEPDGIVLPFLMTHSRHILERLQGHRTAHATLRQAILDVLDGVAPAPRAGPAGPLELLSDAELRVVRYLPSNLRTPEIAAELFVSTNTVRTHLRHIYAKLGAHRRAEAVARARQVGLLAPTLRR